jgi:hypothetical protein
MKEFTIEQKAKLYDEAIERAKKWYNAPNVNKIPTFGNRVIEEIFPELAESEDERIRKALMQNLKERFGTKGNMGEGLDMPDVLAWLERQGDTFDFDKKELKKIELSEWSEEDKCMLNNVIDTLKPLRQTTHSGYSINSMVNWLKSLKDRYTWKPSEGRMKALSAINLTGEISYAGQGQELINLYNDLKKLKGE